ncbi:MAG: iron-sulfur cluster assembly scaffold protein [Candidatus Buchananbacteria bacterium]|nr:iron-sulfur cluster assembly scaffold protein [Candidatus Buchananbacteria bacterium]
MQYTDIVLDHFKNPRNQGELKDADGVGEVGNPVCGDMMKIYIKVGKDEQGQAVIEDIKFQTLGCGAAIAASSMLTEVAKGLTLDKAQKITREDIVEKLGGLPKEKIHCSVLAQEGLKKAIAQYKGETFTESKDTDDAKHAHC